MGIILIPGVSVQAAKGIFDAIRKELPKGNILELSAADLPLLEKETSKLKEKFILIGKSMGGKVALEYQLKHKAASVLVLLAPFVEASNRFKDIKTKTLIVHGTADDVISIDNSRKLQKIMSNCELVVIEGAGHSYRGQEKEVAKAIAKFLS